MTENNPYAVPDAPQASTGGFFKYTPQIYREGMYTFRILRLWTEYSMEDGIYLTHWLPFPAQKKILCLGEGCPACAKIQWAWSVVNEEGITDKEAKFKRLNELSQVGSTNPKNPDYVLEILDTTPVKIHPEAVKGQYNYQKPDGTWPDVDYETGKSLEDITEVPANRISILVLTRPRMETLATACRYVDLTPQQRAQPAYKKHISKVSPLTYDIALEIRKVEKKGVYTFTPLDLGDGNEVHTVEFDGDLTAGFVKLSSEEMQLVLDGVAIQDIWATRKANRQASAPTPAVEISTDVAEKDEAAEEAMEGMDFTDWNKPLD